ncbi:MAG: metal-dependent hydrolase, partial [Candidatus Cloacimonadaceae bacterium]|nr:metal-dependent hydrolase [Candidatus Cloacimonadaceae bacterium]
SFAIAKRHNPLFICVNELANYVAERGFRAHNMHIGGSHDFDFGRLKFTIALHGSQTPDKEYAGLAAGVLIFADGLTIYHTGDTGIFGDMRLIGEMNEIDYMLLPIGDNFTMGVDDAAKAVELACPKVAIPMHYNTFPVIQADPELFAQKVRAMGRTCQVMQPGDTLEC